MFETATPLLRERTESRTARRAPHGIPRRSAPANLELGEYCAFPRRRYEHKQWQIGFVHRAAGTRLRLDVEESVPVGTLLRVLLRDDDGRPTLDVVTRVDWAIQDARARLSLGLSVLADVDRGLARVREPIALASEATSA